MHLQMQLALRALRSHCEMRICLRKLQKIQLSAQYYTVKLTPINCQFYELEFFCIIDYPDDMTMHNVDEKVL
uniref:Uncharacterized protein n=1 Tax=Sulfolobus neozealandicus TaxID=299422 RepID=Q5NDZ4_9CREN|nr:hypothetical protein [Sulfolobus neozealandicus]